MENNKIKSLYESLLDNDDDLFKRTDLIDKFPKYGDLTKTSFTDRIYGLSKRYYYKWSNDVVLDKCCRRMSEIYIKVNSIFLEWNNQSPDMKTPGRISIWYSPSDFKHAHCSRSAFPEIAPSEFTMGTIRKEAYELLFNIRNNIKILKYLYRFNNKNYRGNTVIIEFEDIKNEFKDTWVEVK